MLPASPPEGRSGVGVGDGLAHVFFLYTLHVGGSYSFRSWAHSMQSTPRETVQHHGSGTLSSALISNPSGAATGRGFEAQPDSVNASAITNAGQASPHHRQSMCRAQRPQIRQRINGRPQSPGVRTPRRRTRPSPRPSVAART